MPDYATIAEAGAAFTHDYWAMYPRERALFNYYPGGAAHAGMHTGDGVVADYRPENIARRLREVEAWQATLAGLDDLARTPGDQRDLAILRWVAGGGTFHPDRDPPAPHRPRALRRYRGYLRLPAPRLCPFRGAPARPRRPSGGDSRGVGNRTGEPRHAGRGGATGERPRQLQRARCFHRRRSRRARRALHRCSAARADRTRRGGRGGRLASVRPFPWRAKRPGRRRCRSPSARRASPGCSGRST